MLCECGCGEKTTVYCGKPRQFILGHNGVRPSEPPGMKTCVACDVLKPHEEFWPLKSSRDGRCSCCKTCANARRRARRGTHPETVREQSREYWASKRERQRELRRQSYIRHREARLADAKAWQEANPEKVRETRRRSQAKRRAQMLSAPLGERVEIDAVVLRDEGRCGICNEDLSSADFHVDHIVPLARGGAHCMSNVQLAHPLCNIRKNATMPSKAVAVWT
jgi:5-methylcytosine-specific restriction endonuclease McrA